MKICEDIFGFAKPRNNLIMVELYAALSNKFLIKNKRYSVKGLKFKDPELNAQAEKMNKGQPTERDFSN